MFNLPLHGCIALAVHLPVLLVSVVVALVVSSVECTFLYPPDEQLPMPPHRSLN